MIVASIGFPTFVADHGAVSSPPNMMIHMALDWWRRFLISDRGKKTTPRNMGGSSTFSWKIIDTSRDPVTLPTWKLFTSTETRLSTPERKVDKGNWPSEFESFRTFGSTVWNYELQCLNIKAAPSCKEYGALIALTLDSLFEINC